VTETPPDVSDDRKKVLRRELAVAILLAAFGGVVIALAGTIELGVYTDPLGPRAFPTALGAGIVACGILLAATALLFPGKAAPVSDRGTEGEVERGPLSPARLLGAIVATAAYIAAFEPLGYLLTTPPYVVAILLIHGGTPWRTLLVAPPMITGVLYLAFRYGLLIPVPNGPLEGILP
jgi:putative tricarboxylic transport membrane protein